MRSRFRPSASAVTPVTHEQYAPFLRTARRGAALVERSGVRRSRSARRRCHLVRGRSAFAEWLGRTHGGSGACRPKPSGSGPRAAASCRQRPRRGATRCPPGEVPDGPLDGPWRVGRGTPNGYGLLRHGHDRARVVRGLVRPGYYADSPDADPRGPEEGERRASRGGSWRHHVRWSPPAARSSLPPSSRYADYGFRVVCTSG